MKKLTKIFATSLLVTLLVGVMAFAFPTQTVAAESLDETPPQTEGKFSGLVKGRLENLFGRTQNALDHQAENIAKLGEESSKAQARIDALKAKGIDTSALEAALTVFEGKLPAIEASHENAASIVAAHSGFGADGKVTDIAAAKSTLKSAHEGLQATRQLMKDAVKELRQAVRDFRAAHKPAPTEVPGV